MTPRWSKADSNSESHPRATPPAATRFVADSALEGAGFERSASRCASSANNRVAGTLRGIWRSRFSGNTPQDSTGVMTVRRLISSSKLSCAFRFWPADF